MRNNLNVSSDEKKLLWQLFNRSNFIMMGFNWVRMQGLAFLWAIQPMLKKIYKDDHEGYIQSLKRHSQFFNIVPQGASFVAGLVLSMEEENEKKPKGFDAESINCIKIGLMGPISGIGDSFFSGTLRIIATGIGLGLAQQGNIFGPIIFLIIYNIPNLLCRYYGGVLGYKLGGKYINKAIESGVLESITKAASIMGLMMVGAMSCQMVSFKTTIETTIGGQPFVLQNILDSILVGILPLSVVLLCLKLVSKKVNPNLILIGILIFSFVCAFFSLAG